MRGKSYLKLKKNYQISDEHVKNNQDICNLLAKSIILPENLPPEEDTKKNEKIITNENSKIINDIKSLPKKQIK